MSLLKKKHGSVTGSMIGYKAKAELRKDFMRSRKKRQNSFNVIKIL